MKFPSDPSRREDEVRTYDGNAGWMAVPHAVVREYALGGSELDGARLDAQLSFPGQIRQAVTNLRVGPPEAIEGRPVHVVQGTGSRGLIAEAVLRRRVGFASACRPIWRFPDRSSAHTDRLRRLSRRERHQDALPLDVRMARRADRFPAEGIAAQYRHRSGGLREASAPAAVKRYLSRTEGQIGSFNPEDGRKGSTMDGRLKIGAAVFTCGFILFLATASIAFGQGQGNGVFTGTVADSGGVIPGATITATNAATGLIRSTTTSDQVLSVCSRCHPVGILYAWKWRVSSRSI